MSSEFEVIIPIDTGDCEAHRLVDNKMFQSLAHDINNRLWHLALVPRGRECVMFDRNSVVIHTPHRIDDKFVKWAMEQCEEVYDPHKAGPALREPFESS